VKHVSQYSLVMQSQYATTAVALVAIAAAGCASPDTGTQAQDRRRSRTAQPGMTAEWLARVLECHSAAATLGQTADDPDPFFLPDAVVDITVQPAKDGLTRRTPIAHGGANEVPPCWT
jgi:hypothetical protein